MTDSSQRQKPGPGKPLTAQRELYLRLMKQGLNNSEACRLLGIHGKTGQRWRRGRRHRARGREYYYRPITAPPPPVSARFLSEDERVRIADLYRLGSSKRAIARKLGRDPSTISRELRRNADPVTGSYRPFTAHRRALGRRPRPRPAKLAADLELRTMVAPPIPAHEQSARHRHQSHQDRTRTCFCGLPFPRPRRLRPYAANGSQHPPGRPGQHHGPQAGGRRLRDGTRGRDDLPRRPRRSHPPAQPVTLQANAPGRERYPRPERPARSSPPQASPIP